MKGRPRRSRSCGRPAAQRSTPGRPVRLWGMATASDGRAIADEELRWELDGQRVEPGGDIRLELGSWEGEHVAVLRARDGERSAEARVVFRATGSGRASAPCRRMTEPLRAVRESLSTIPTEWAGPQRVSDGAVLRAERVRELLDPALACRNAGRPSCVIAQVSVSEAQRSCSSPAARAPPSSRTRESMRRIGALDWRSGRRRRCSSASATNTRTYDGSTPTMPSRTRRSRAIADTLGCKVLCTTHQSPSDTADVRHALP